MLMAKIAYVLINCDIGKESKVLEELRRTPGVSEAHLLYGVYDIIVKVTGETDSEIRDIVTNNIRRISGVRRTLTMPVID